MITRKEAVAKSVRRWTALARREETVIACGLCLYSLDHKDDTNDSCGGCPLFPDICRTNAMLEPLYWQWFFEWDSDKKIKLAKQILEAIKTRGKKWIEEEK